MADNEFPAGDSFQGPAELRAAYDRATRALREREQRIGTLEAELKGTRIARAGFPEGSEGHTLLTDFYPGDLSKSDEMVAFAAKYGHKPGVPAAPPVPPAGPDVVESGDSQLGTLQAGSAALVPQGEPERLAMEVTKAEQERRPMEAIRLKNQLHQLLRATGK